MIFPSSDFVIMAIYISRALAPELSRARNVAKAETGISTTAVSSQYFKSFFIIRVIGETGTPCLFLLILLTICAGIEMTEYITAKNTAILMIPIAEFST